jgi:hypothetical protein
MGAADELLVARKYDETNVFDIEHIRYLIEAFEDDRSSASKVGRSSLSIRRGPCQSEPHAQHLAPRVRSAGVPELGLVAFES